MTHMVTDTKLTLLRESLTALQGSMLDRVWASLVERGKPISTRAFFHVHPRDQAEPGLDALGGKIIIQHYVDGVSSFSPTLLGALLSSGGQNLESLLCRCLQFVRDQYEAQPELNSYTSEQLQKSCAFRSSEVEELRLMLSLAYHTLVVFGGGGQPGGPWMLLSRDEVDQLRQVMDWRAYVHTEVMKGFDPSFPVSEAKRAVFDLPHWSLLGRSPPPSDEHAAGDQGDALSFEFVADETLRDILANDWGDALRVLQIGAWKACIMLCGGVLEGILLALAQIASTAKRAEAVRRLKMANVSLEKLGLDDLLRLCGDLKLLDIERAHLGQFIRAHRNLIHPGLQSRKDVTVQREEAVIAINAVKSIARTFSERHSAASDSSS